MNAGTLSGPVEITIPVKNPMTAPASASCQSPIRELRACSQRLAGTMARKNTPEMMSINRGGSTNSVRAPSAAAGTPVIEYAAHARQPTWRHHANALPTLDIKAAIAMIGTACLGPN